MYYNYDKINSYNAMYNFILTNRGFGKSFGAKKRAIDRFLKYGEQFIYVRRYKTELKKIGKYFEDIQGHYPNVKFKVVGKTFYINDKVCGWAIPLSTSMTEKSVAYPLVTTIIFDEFIIPEGHLRYLNDEVTTMLELTFTVVRDRDKLKVYFLANNISEVNPYFTYFNIKMPDGVAFKTFKNGSIVVEKNTSDVFVEKMKNTPFGKLIEGTRYSDYSIENKSLCDTDTFIERMPLKNCIPICNVLYDGFAIQIWINKKNNCYYCNGKIVSGTEQFTFNSDDHTEKSILSAKSLKFSIFDDVIKNFQMGNVRFENQNIKHNMYKVFKLLGVR